MFLQWLANNRVTKGLGPAFLAHVPLTVLPLWTKPWKRECPQSWLPLCYNPIERLPLECSRECSRGCPRKCTRSGLGVCHLVCFHLLCSLPTKGSFPKGWVWRMFRGPPKNCPEGPARQIDVSRQKLSPHCLEAIFDSQLPSPKLSPKMPPKLSLPHKGGLFILFEN